MEPLELKNAIGKFVIFKRKKSSILGKILKYNQKTVSIEVKRRYIYTYRIPFADVTKIVGGPY